MANPILYLDHDVHFYFVAALRRHGYEAHSTQEFRNQQLNDEEQLTFATKRKWTLISYNGGKLIAEHFPSGKEFFLSNAPQCSREAVCVVRTVGLKIQRE